MSKPHFSPHSVAYIKQLLKDGNLNQITSEMIESGQFDKEFNEFKQNYPLAWEGLTSED